MPYTFDRAAPPDFNIPTNNSGRGNVLKVGRGISIYWDVQPSNFWSEHQHPTIQIVIALDPIDAEMSWGRTQENHERSCIPHLWCLPHDTPHLSTWIGKAAMVVFYVERDLVRDEFGADVQHGAVLPLAPLVQQDYLLARLCDRFREHCHRRKLMSEPMLFAGAIMLSIAVLNRCIGRGATKARPSRGLDNRRMEILTHYLESHLRDRLTPAILAAAVGMGEDHFGRMLRISTGLPPMEYVWRCRLHRARLLLESGEWKVAQVAAECGFCDQSHLDRRFRKEFGCTRGFVVPPASAGNG